MTNIEKQIDNEIKEKFNFNNSFEKIKDKINNNLLNNNFKIKEFNNGDKGHQPYILLENINTKEIVTITISNGQKFIITKEN